MKYIFTFNEINSGRIEMESDHKPDNGEIINGILGGKADYSDTDFTDFRLVETNDNTIGEDTNSTDTFKVTITEMLQKVVTVNANSSDEAEHTIGKQWADGVYVLDANHFNGVEFNAELTD